MVKTEEKSSNNWYVFLFIGLLLGAVLGYYASQKGWLGSSAVGRNPDYLSKCLAQASSDCSSNSDLISRYGTGTTGQFLCKQDYRNACNDAYS